MAQEENTLTRKCRVQVPLNKDIVKSSSNDGFNDEDDKSTTFRPQSQVILRFT